MICKRNATSDSSRLFFAMRIKRVFGANPKPCSRCCVNLNWKFEFNCGLSTLKGAFPTVCRVLLNPTDTLVPQWKPCMYEKLAVVVFCGDAGLNVLEGKMLKWSL